jgi:hypothetical protein
MNEFEQGLQEMKQSIYKSLADFQQECPIIHKGTTGYGYSYADLPTIFEVINPLLAKHGLGFTQLFNGDSIETVLFHVETGQEIKSVTAIPQNVQLKGMNEFQVMGSAVTYIRRYALSSMLGIVTDKDTDANGKAEKQKPKLSDERFQKALEANYDKEALKKNFALTAEQLKQLNEVK